MILDVPTNWRKWNSWVEGAKPDPEEGHIIVAIDPLLTVEKTDPFDLYEMRAWLQANVNSPFQMWGRWDFVRHQFRIDRTLVSFVILFMDEDDAFFFKMRWG